MTLSLRMLYVDFSVLITEGSEHNTVMILFDSLKETV